MRIRMHVGWNGPGSDDDPVVFDWRFVGAAFALGIAIGVMLGILL